MVRSHDGGASWGKSIVYIHDAGFSEPPHETTLIPSPNLASSHDPSRSHLQKRKQWFVIKTEGRELRYSIPVVTHPITNNLHRQLILGIWSIEAFNDVFQE